MNKFYLMGLFFLIINVFCDNSSVSIINDSISENIVPSVTDSIQNLRQTEVDSIKKTKFKYVKNGAFKKNEYLHFSVKYGVILAGYASIGVSNIENFKGRDCYVLKTTAKSRRAFDWVFKVRDKTISYLDTTYLHSLRFEKHLREGGYKRDIVIDYDQQNNLAYYSSKKPSSKKAKTNTIKTPDNVLDALSALYFVRTQDFKVGDEILLPGTDNKKVYPIKIIVHKIETIKVEAGKFRCFVIEPVMADGGIFKKDGKVKIWVTTDSRKMPVKMASKVFIGSIVAELDWYEEGK